MMVEFCYCAVGSGTSNCPCFVRHRRAYHLSSKCCRTNCSAHYCMIVSRWAHSRSCVYKYLVLLCVEQCDYWNFGYQYLVLCAPCELAHIMVHFRTAFCCHYCCYCHWLFYRNSNESEITRQFPFKAVNSSELPFVP